jgi:acyl transferase domain-containing protein
VVVLSARTEERLRERAAQLVAAVDAGGLADADLADIAYTLQVGRDPMEVRLAVGVDSVAELSARLRGYLDGATVDGLHVGDVRKHRDTLALLNTDEVRREATLRVAAEGGLARLLGLWVRGLAVDWTELHIGQNPRRVPLPTYPFARDRYWVGAAGGAAPFDVGLVDGLFDSLIAGEREESTTVDELRAALSI